MTNFAVYEFSNEIQKNILRGEFESLDKVKSNFSTYSKFYHSEPSFPYLFVVAEEISPEQVRNHIGTFFMGK